MISAPRTGWTFIDGRSSRVSRSCLSSTESGTPILPMSCRRPPHSRASSSSSPTFIDPADVHGDRLDPVAVAAGEGVALVDRLGQAPDRLGEHLPDFHEALVGQARRVQRHGEQQHATTGAVMYICAISHATGARASMLTYAPASARTSLQHRLAALGTTRTRRDQDVEGEEDDCRARQSPRSRSPADVRAESGPCVAERRR